MEPKFITGDKVRLISGGPDMTIRGIHYDVLANEYRNDMFDCIWFDRDKNGKKEVHYCPFYEDELVKVIGISNDTAA
jgi:uncharacterized protein YodC (DUF2158 family)